jgi:hypothetical protein
MLNWFFKRDHGDKMASREEVQRAIARIVAISPQVKLVNRYESRLAPAIGKALAYVRQVVAALPPPRDLTPGAWANDPNLRVMFATRDDVTEVIGRSHELRAWFDDHLAPEHAHAVLSSVLVERGVLSTVLEGGVMRSDVARTAVGFDDKRITFCNETEAALREEIVQRLVEHLALEAMSRVSAQEARREALKEHQALLTARIQMLSRRGVGMFGLTAPEDSDGDTVRLQRDFAANEAALAALGSPADAIDMLLRTIIQVLQQPSALLELTRRTLRLNQMNLVVAKGSDERCTDVVLHLARLPTRPPQSRVVGLVRVARRDMPSAGAASNDVANIVL